MRLSVQGCLILWLCLYSTLSFAGYPSLPDGGFVYAAKKGGLEFGENNPPSADKWKDMMWWAEPALEGCTEQHPDMHCEIQGYDGPHEFTGKDQFGGNRYWMDTFIRVVALPAGSVCEPPNFLNQEGECVSPSDPDECRENGDAYDPETRQCVPECEHGVLNGTCLPAPEEPNECNSDSPDYRGQIVQGYGKSPINFCGDIDQCSGDKPGQIGLVNGELRCIAEDYGVPKCQGDSITVVDEYGFICEPLENQPEEEPDTPEEPNTDTDGDGEPDEYQRENDPDAVNKGLDKVVDAINEGNRKTDTSNQHLGKIENAVKSIADDVSSLEQMGKNGELGGGGGSGGGGDGLKNPDGEDYLGDLADIKENTKNTADGIDDLNEKLDNPENGYSTDGLGDAPTFEESAVRLQGIITGNPTIKAVTTIPTVAENTTCPVWTIPATDYWSAMPLDTHCDILETHRGLLSLIFMAVWTLAAVFVFLRA